MSQSPSDRPPQFQFRSMRVIGHGVDIIDNARIARMLEAHGRRFVERVFTQGERAYAEDARKRRVERYAVRFAAKEAALKAIGTGWRDGIAWTDVEVVLLPSGQPSLRVEGLVARLAHDLGIDTWRLSLSHVELMSMASVLAGCSDTV